MNIVLSIVLVRRIRRQYYSDHLVPFVKTSKDLSTFRWMVNVIYQDSLGKFFSLIWYLLERTTFSSLFRLIVLVSMGRV